MVHDHSHCSLSQIHNLSQIYPINTVTMFIYTVVHFNIIFPSNPRSSKWPHSFRLCDQSSVHISLLLMSCFMSVCCRGVPERLWVQDAGWSGKWTVRPRFWCLLYLWVTIHHFISTAGSPSSVWFFNLIMVVCSLESRRYQLYALTFDSVSKASDMFNKLSNQHSSTVPCNIPCWRFHFQWHFLTNTLYILLISTMLAMLLSEGSLILCS